MPEFNDRRTGKRTPLFPPDAFLFGGDSIGKLPPEMHARSKAILGGKDPEFKSMYEYMRHPDTQKAMADAGTSLVTRVAQTIGAKISDLSAPLVNKGFDKLESKIGRKK